MAASFDSTLPTQAPHPNARDRVRKALLAGAATLLARLAAKPRRRVGLWLRQGLAALARPGAGTLGGIVALGLGVLVVLAMHLVERGLLTGEERDWLDAYHARVQAEIAPQLEGAAKGWLAEVTAPLGA